MSLVSQLPITGVIMKLQRQAKDEAAKLLRDRIELPQGELMGLLELLRFCGILDQIILEETQELSETSLKGIREGTSSYTTFENYRLAQILHAVLQKRGIQFYDGNQYDQEAA